MKNKGITLILLSIFLLCTSQLISQNKAGLESVVQQFYETGNFSGTVLIAQKGEVIYEKAIGMANREWGIPHEMEGKFIIGSLSKQFIAALALILKQEGKLRLDAYINEYLPDFPNHEIASKITIHQLISCSSGLPHYGAWNDFMEHRDRLSYTRASLLELFKDVELRFEPGERHGYSSLGYLILGFILEEAGGDDLGSLLSKKIFGPCQMENTSLDDHVSILPKRVEAYRYNYKLAKYDNANYRDPSTTFSAGGIITTAGDLLKWDQALSKNHLLTESSKKILFAPVFSNYAYGWRTVMPGRSDSLEIQWHAGQVTGYLSIMSRLPKDGYCIILLSNIRDMAYRDMTNQLINVLYNLPLEPPQRSLLKRLLEEIVSKGPQAAIQEYHQLKEKAFDQYSFSEVELLILGIELNSEGMYEEAIEMLKLSKKEYPESRYLADNWLLLGENYEALENKNKALECYKEVLKINPDNERASQRIEGLNNP